MLPLEVAVLKTPRTNPCFSEGVVAMRSVCAGLTVPEKKEQTKRIVARTQKLGARARSG